ncbi:uncharacterized protein [Triticum aestivum]|uniref:uncharacterized protein n=1 Tax=Triticum aestivum TaxID=4565 RepID=UPI001D0246A9|nr:uncharacterized protein LOC123078548 [Triticum aestivum]
MNTAGLPLDTTDERPRLTPPPLTLPSIKRLSKMARDGLPAERTSDLFGWGLSAVERARYSELRILGAKACHVAANNPFLFDKLQKTFQDIISNKDAPDNEADGHRSSMNEEACECQRDAVVIGDPLKVCTNGAPKQTRKGRANGGPEVTKNGRPKAFGEKSDRLCGICHKPGHNRQTCSENPNNMA